MKNISVIKTQDIATSASTWQKQDTVWMLSLYGTAIGAGTLFLPINAGLHGIWPVIFMLIFAFPLTYYSHRALCFFVLSGSKSTHSMSNVVEEHFGKRAGAWLTVLYFLSIYPLLFICSIAITNTTQDFIVNQLGMMPPPRSLLSFLLVISLMIVIRFGQDAIVKSMSMLVYPFISVLLLLAAYLVPHWSGEVLHYSASQHGHWAFMKALWLMIPVMVFSFNHSPIISTFTIKQKRSYGKHAEGKCLLILKYSHILMMLTVMFFVLSCVFSLSPAKLAEAKAQNISILSYLANNFKAPVIQYVAPIVAFTAITQSFFGHYLGASEGMRGIITRCAQMRNYHINERLQQHIADVLILLTCWMVATVNPSILGMIETLCGPAVAMLLFILPMYAIATVPILSRYRDNLFSNIFVTTIGVIAVSAILYGLRS